MRSLAILVGRILVEARWALVPSMVVMALLGWLGLMRTSRLETEIRSWVAKGDFERVARFARSAGMMGQPGSGGTAEAPPTEFPSKVIELQGWSLPGILLVVIIWAIGRGSAAVAGEIERGTLDLVLTRPVSRSVYLMAHTVAACLGLVLVATALLAGHALGLLRFVVSDPPSTLSLVRPAANLALLGFALYGLTLLASSMDRVRWRPNLIATSFALLSFILIAVVNQTGMEEWKPLERFSIFKAYNPIEVGTRGETWLPNASALGGVGLTGLVAALVAFNRRDLPAGS